MARGGEPSHARTSLRERAGGLEVAFGGVEERSTRRADASDEIEGADVPRAGRAAAEHGVARPSAESDSGPARDRELQRTRPAYSSSMILATSCAPASIMPTLMGSEKRRGPAEPGLK